MSDEDFSRTAFLESRLPNISTEENFLAFGEVSHTLGNDQ